MPRLRKKRKILSLAKKKSQKKKQVTVIQPQVSIRYDHQVKEREPVSPKRQELPDNYGDNHIYLMVRDSHWLYAYWEIQKDHQQKCLALLRGEWSHVRSILRVYDTTDRKSRPGYFDILLEELASHWYIHARPNRSFVIEIGLLHNDGRFIVLARSNEQTTPRDGMSEILDEEWTGIDFDKMYALSGGFEVGKSSLELKKLMEKRLWGAISSGSGVSQISSFGASPVKIKKRGFWFVLDCELIVYGATEPGATVTLGGKPVQLRPDGTFTLRFALPDGKIELDAHACSADGLEERIIKSVVERNTERPAPVLRKEAEQQNILSPL